jgi:hypothetical protein
MEVISELITHAHAHALLLPDVLPVSQWRTCTQPPWPPLLANMGASQGGRKRLMGSLVIRSGKTIKNKIINMDKIDVTLCWNGKVISLYLLFGVHFIQGTCWHQQNRKRSWRGAVAEHLSSFLALFSAPLLNLLLRQWQVEHLH